MIVLVKFLVKNASKSSFFRFGVEIRFWSCKIPAICGAVVRKSFALCNSVSADGSVMAVSRFLAAAAASVIVMAAWKLRTVLWQRIFSFCIDDVPFKIRFKKCLEIVVFPLWRRDPVSELQIAVICGAVVRNSSVLCKRVIADRNGSIIQCNGCMTIANGGYRQQQLRMEVRQQMFSFSQCLLLFLCATRKL